MLRVVRSEADRDADLQGITVAKAAEILGVDQSTIRALIRNGVLEAWRAGKTDDPGGIRIERQSCLAYRRRHSITKGQAHNDSDIPVERRKARPSTPGYREALAELRRLGVRLPRV